MGANDVPLGTNMNIKKGNWNCKTTMKLKKKKYLIRITYVVKM